MRVQAPVSLSATCEVIRWTAERGLNAAEDQLAREEPLEIRVQGRCLVVTMRTPGHDEELAAGYLFSEGLVQERRQILELARCRQASDADGANIMNGFLAPGTEIDFERLARHAQATSSCGVCGKASIDSVHQHFPPITANFVMDAGVLIALPDRLRAAQLTFERTGGLHAAGLFNAAGELLVAREDVGRHNAVDKVIGRGLLDGDLPWDRHALVVSGRVSFEIMQKALAAGIPIIAAISAPSSLAVEFALESGQTLVGFLRGTSMNVYASSHRITAPIVG